MTCFTLKPASVMDDLKRGMTRPSRVFRRPWFAALIAVAVILVPATPVRAIDLFQILVTNTDGSGVPDLLVGGSSLPDLLNNLVNMTGAFAGFDGVEWNADITFMGVQDAINVTFDPVAGEATLTFSLLGGAAETFVFNGGNLAEQIENFLQGQLSQQVQAHLDGCPHCREHYEIKFSVDRGEAALGLATRAVPRPADKMPQGVDDRTALEPWVLATGSVVR